jgi:hypothetical protein
MIVWVSFRDGGGRSKIYILRSSDWVALVTELKSRFNMASTSFRFATFGCSQRLAYPTRKHPGDLGEFVSIWMLPNSCQLINLLSCLLSS